MAKKLTFKEILSGDNLVDHLDESVLEDIGQDVIKGYTTDRDSRQMWDIKAKSAMELALQITKDKTIPWPKASNVKYPLMTIAAIQFAARAYPNLIQDRNIAKYVVIGKDENGEKATRAARMSLRTNYQLFEEMDAWEEEMDRMLHILAIVGVCFKKTYPMADGTPMSELVLPDNFVVDYYTKRLDGAFRQTHLVPLYNNEIIENIRKGLFRDVEYGDPGIPEIKMKSVKESLGHSEPANNENASHYLLEQHTWMDLDGDDYMEPYIVTVHWKSGKVFRIEPRFKPDAVERNEAGEIAQIVADQYFTKYGFIPSPDGGFYDLGFGTLLAPINETVNTLINQLIDSGTLNNLGGGFISRGISMKGGSQKFRPGEYKPVDMTGDDIRKGIVNLPTKEPSGVLFSMLGMLIESGEKMASITDPVTGKSPGTHVPATSTLALIEQGMKVFSGISKRIHRSLKQELRKIHDINKFFPNFEAYNAIVDEGDKVAEQDYAASDTDIKPYSDPAIVSDAQKLAKVEPLMELLDRPEVENKEIISLFLEALQTPNKEKVLPPQKSEQPDPRMLLEMAKLENETEKIKLKQKELDMKMIKSKAEATKLEAEAIDTLARTEAEVSPADIEEGTDKFIALKGEKDEKHEKIGSDEEPVQGMAQAAGDQGGVPQGGGL